MRVRTSLILSILHLPPLLACSAPGWPPEAGSDPWVLVSREINNPDFRDAFIGNGFIGQRVGPEGEASAYAAGGDCRIHGLWGENALIPAPGWCRLRYFDGNAWYALDAGEHRDYEQRLDMRDGLILTRDTWRDGERTTGIRTTTFVSRAQRDLAAVFLSVTPDFSGEVRIEDVVTGLDPSGQWERIALPACAAARPSDPDPVAFAGRLGPRKRLLAVAEQVHLPEGWASVAEAGGRPRAAAVRVFRFPVEAGRTYLITKWVSIVSDADAERPVERARESVVRASRAPAGELERHREAWRALWAGGIEVDDARVQTLVNAALYQLYANLREDVPWSVGPAGLTGDAWGGRVFWDADLWVFPAVVLFRPELARSIVAYRHRTLAGARRNAQAEGRRGACFAWESAETGDEKVPIPAIRHQRHVNSDVALAQWQYALVAGDEAYLREKGAEVILESARYWADRAVRNAEKDRWEIRAVFCSDEFAGIRNNDATTNYGAAVTLRRAARIARRLGREVPPEWEAIAAGLWLPYDADNRRYIEYEGYAGKTIKQADTALLVYPWEMPMPDDVKAGIVDYYRTKYPPQHIMMSSAFDGIVDCELSRPGRAWASLLDLLPHFRRPFLVVSEAPDNETISFLTGLGGFLQLVVNGYAGVRIHDDGLLVQPCLPPGWSRMALRGVHYGGVSFDLEITEGGRRATAKNFSGPAPFRLYDRQGRDVPRE